MTFPLTNGTLIASLLTLLNPIVISLLYLNAKPRATLQESVRDGITLCLGSTAIMLVIIIAGTSLLDAIGVKLLAIQIAGGIILTLSVYGLMNNNPAEEINESQRNHSIITPFVTPICVGGASISLLFSFIGAIPQRSFGAMLSLSSAVFICFAVIGAFLPIAVMSFQRIPGGMLEIIRSISLFIVFAIGITILLDALPDVVSLASG